jgi:hypothetical protein
MSDEINLPDDQKNLAVLVLAVCAKKALLTLTPINELNFKIQILY